MLIVIIIFYVKRIVRYMGPIIIPFFSKYSTGIQVRTILFATLVLVK